MPLVIVSGLPCSGKTTRSRELYAYLQANAGTGQTVHLISEEEHGARRASEYASSVVEKKARGNFFSAVERLLSPTCIVIADGLNYIKGYRYQLYCLARAASTPHCVLYCVASERLCRERNERRLAGEEASRTYPREVFEELLLRFEEPSNQARWDSPLFTVGGEEEGEDEDCSMSWTPVLEALRGGSVRPPSFATAPKSGSGANSNLLMTLDRNTQAVVEAILETVKRGGTPCCVTIDEGEGEKLMVRVGRPVLGSDLQRLRRQFIHMNRLHQADAASITPLFVHYLNEHL